LDLDTASEKITETEKVYGTIGGEKYSPRCGVGGGTDLDVGGRENQKVVSVKSLKGEGKKLGICSPEWGGQGIGKGFDGCIPI